MDVSIRIMGIAGRLVMALSVALAATVASAGTYEIVHVFTNGATGYFPTALTVDAQGNVYGVSQAGGAGGSGTLFKVTATGTIALHSFGSGRDGRTPIGAPLVGSDGFLYGTTYSGGLHNTGTVYRMDTSGGNYQVLSMNKNMDILAGLVEDGAGNFFGVSSSDIRHDNLYWPGTVFRASFQTEKIQTLHKFHGFDGDSPRGRLAWFDGKLIGTTYEGGIENRGVAFAIHPDGTGFAVKRLLNGAWQAAGLTVDSDGRIWGLSSVDRAKPGVGYGGGGLYQIDLQGQARVALRFTAELGVGNDSSLMLASDGLLYNAAPFGGDPVCSCGTIYRFDPVTETIEVLHLFTDNNMGYRPRGGVVEASPGVFYGVTQAGPDSTSGAVYRFTP